MSKKINDGGPAFGHAAENGHCCGMTLRDWFAGMALTGINASPETSTNASPEDIARDALAQADAVIAEKQR